MSLSSSDSAVSPNLHAQWMNAWPRALEVWSKFTRLRPPTLCLTFESALREGLSGSFAMIRLEDQAVIVSLAAIINCKLEDYAVEVLAHEIGHHILAPANLTDHARMITRMRYSLPTVEKFAPLVANLYTDLLINDRLQRCSQLRLADIYRKIRSSTNQASGAIWKLYMRIFENLWGLQKGFLGGGETNDHIEGDAVLGARLIRNYARDWLDGSGRFAALLLPHLLEDQQSSSLIKQLLDTENAGANGNPAGLAEEEPDERQGAIHPLQDPDLSDFPEAENADGAKDSSKSSSNNQPEETDKNKLPKGQAREPYQYGEILRAAGIVISDHDAAVRYYRERAQPHLVPFPSQIRPESKDPLPEGLESWDIGQPLDDVDWMQSVLQSPKVIPGMTTVQRVWGTTEGTLPEKIPLDLDLYVDSSGSMQNPQQLISYPALAGAILCLSALRAGARVQVTLWSGKQQFTKTDGFVRNEETILGVLTGYFGGATAFPIHILRETYKNRPSGSRSVHIMVISDDGVSTLFDNDERGNSGWDIAQMALERAGGGGTFVLNILYNWENHSAFSFLNKVKNKQHWNIYRVSSWEELISFARQFSRQHYGDTESNIKHAAKNLEGTF